MLCLDFVDGVCVCVCMCVCVCVCVEINMIVHIVRSSLVSALCVMTNTQ